ncbi:MAG TPA: hypothetical protein VK669_08240 [Candidatus Limnocylindrales bacterium]|nr:hypothetical protein [Candidatus Limnocylindrales bacterium]
MRARSLIALASLAAATASSVVPVPARAEKVCAWSIPVEMIDKVYSGNAHAGQPFKFRVTEDAARDDGTKIPSGSIGYGVVRGASAAGRHNHDGSIAIEPRYIMVPNAKGGGNERIEVTMNPMLPVMWTPTEPLLNKAASHVPLPVPGLIMTGVNTVRWGRNITLGPGFKFTVLPVENLSTNAPVC